MQILSLSHRLGTHKPFLMSQCSAQPLFFLLSFSSQERQVYPHCSRQKKQKGYVLRQPVYKGLVNTNATIDALHLAAILSSHPGNSGTKVLSEWEVVAAWQ